MAVMIIIAIKIIFLKDATSWSKLDLSQEALREVEKKPVLAGALREERKRKEGC
jgi:hypothetical protein